MERPLDIFRQLFDVVETKETLFLVMELVEVPECMYCSNYCRAASHKSQAHDLGWRARKTVRGATSLMTSSVPRADTSLNMRRRCYCVCCSFRARAHFGVDEWHAKGVSRQI